PVFRHRVAVGRDGHEVPTHGRAVVGRSHGCKDMQTEWLIGVVNRDGHIEHGRHPLTHKDLLLLAAHEYRHLPVALDQLVSGFAACRRNRLGGIEGRLWLLGVFPPQSSRWKGKELTQLPTGLAWHPPPRRTCATRWAQALPEPPKRPGRAQRCPCDLLSPRRCRTIDVARRISRCRPPPQG